MSDAKGEALLRDMESRLPDRFIVAEISKNWPESELDAVAWNRGEVNEAGLRRLLSERFEEVINTNHARGYKLTDWKLSRWHDRQRDTLNETIIAIFERRDG